MNRLRPSMALFWPVRAQLRTQIQPRIRPSFSFLRWNSTDPPKRSSDTPKDLANLKKELDRLSNRSDSQALVPAEQLKALATIQKRVHREMLLSQQKNFLGRLAVRFKWFMIRGYRPFNTDDFSAMFSWIIWGHILWIVLGTTTFFSLLFWTLSRLKAEDYLATVVANIVTKETGLQVVFEEAIPDWKQGVLVFRKVFVSKRPGERQKARVGNQREAALQPRQEAKDDGNYTQFDLTFDSVAVSLSVWRWLAGKGILLTADLKGVRGVVDRRHLKHDPNWDPVKHRNVPKRGDFHIESFKIDDLLVDVQFPTHTTQASIFNCELPQLRKQWLLFDFMNADRITGSYDNSLFTLHPRQHTHPLNKNKSFKRIQRLRVDDVDVRNLNRGVEGMFGWIESGTVDFLADIMLPSDLPDVDFREQVQNVIEHWEHSVTGKPNTETAVERKLHERQERKAVYIDLRVQFNNTRAAAPFFTNDLTYLNNALIHPIIAYINSRDTYIPVHCRVIKKLSDFNGSWTIYDSTLMQDVSDNLYEACAQNAADEEARKRRIRKVGFWSLQFLAQLVLLTLGIVA